MDGQATPCQLKKKKLKLEQVWSRSANLGIETALDLALDACKQGWSPAHR